MAKERVAQDFYPTPNWCIDALLSYLNPKDGDVFLEPAMGDGRIFDRFPFGHDKKWAELSAHRDYLNPMGLDLSADVIITNPPFSHALEFVRTAIERDLKDNGTVCMLLRNSFLGSKERADFWREFPITNLVVLTPRPAFVHGKTDNSEYSWFIWDYGDRTDLPALWTVKREEHDKDYREAQALKAKRSAEAAAKRAEKSRKAAEKAAVKSGVTVK